VVTDAHLVQGNASFVYDYFYVQPAVDTEGRGFLGFSAVITADGERRTKTTAFYENEHLEGALHGYHVYPYAFTPFEVDAATGADAFADLEGTFAPSATTVLETRSEVKSVQRRLHILNSPDGTLSSSSTFFIETFFSKDDKKDANGGTYYSGSRSQVYDDFANVTSVDAFNGPEETIGTLLFNNDTGAWLIGQRSHKEEKHFRIDGPVDAITQNPTVGDYAYGSAGELRQQTTTLPNAIETITNFTRDDAGLVTSVESHDGSGNERAVSYEYSSDGVYRQHMQDALGHDTWVGYHSGLGVPLITVDENGNPTLYKYDGFGRAVSIQPTRAPLTTNTYSQGAGQITVVTTQSPGTQVKKQIDSFGNVTSVTTNIGGRTSFTSYGHDGIGRLVSETIPTFIDDAGQGFLATYSYDNLNQIRSATKSDGSSIVVNLVSPLISDVVSTSDQVRTTEITKTPDGLVESVVEEASSGAVTTRGVSYVYGQGQELDAVTEIGGPTTTYRYFGSPKPTIIMDAEHGQTTITYDGFGQVHHVQHDPRYPSTADYEYDVLGRTTHLTASQPDPYTPGSMVTTSTGYAYDSGQGAIGQISSAVSPDGVTTSYSYTVQGLLSEVKYDSTLGSFSTDYVYDSTGRLAHVDYPDAQNGLPRFGVDFNYNDGVAGNLATADGSLQSITRVNDNFWTAVSRSATGIAENTTLAGGLTQGLTINPTTLQLSDISVAQAGTNVYSVHYDYFTGGNIQTRTDELAGTADQYTYDGFDQLLTWTTSSNAGTSQEQYGYDSLGNQKTTGAATQIFGGSGFSPHQVASRTKGTETRTFGYDPLGRQTTMTVNGALARTINYTPFDLPSFVSTPTSPVSYKYDASQQKFNQSSAAFDTVYVGDLYERRTNKSTCKVDDVFYIYAEGQRIAQVVQEHDGGLCIGPDPSGGGLIGTVTVHPATAVETISALHADLQGNVTASTTIGATISTNRQAFSPWGDRLPLATGATTSSIDKVTVGFTDQEQEDDLGVVNMHGRIYDPATRTFLTPDPITNSPLKVSGWNKYAYVLNNPTKYVDPSGFADVTVTNNTTGEQSSFELDLVIKAPGPASIATTNSDGQIPAAPSTVPGYNPGDSTDLGSTPGSVQELQPEAYAITFYPHGPGTSDPFGLQPDFTVQPDWSVPTPAPSAFDQLVAGGPGGGNTGWVLERPKPVPGVGDVYTAFFDPNATDEQKDAARAELAVNGIFMAVTALTPGAEEAVAAADGVGAVDGQLPTYLYHYTSEESAAAIESSGFLGRGGDHALYLTPSGGLQPLQAGIELALPQSNTATALFRVPSSALRADAVERTGSVVGNVFGRGGGGAEVVYSGRIPVNLIVRVR
jgi:RHS repeat-associated protein